MFSFYITEDAGGSNKFAKPMQNLNQHCWVSTFFDGFGKISCFFGWLWKCFPFFNSRCWWALVGPTKNKTNASSSLGLSCFVDHLEPNPNKAQQPTKFATQNSQDQELCWKAHGWPVAGGRWQWRWCSWWPVAAEAEAEVGESCALFGLGFGLWGPRCPLAIQDQLPARKERNPFTFETFATFLHHGMSVWLHPSGPWVKMSQSQHWRTEGWRLYPKLWTVNYARLSSPKPARRKACNQIKRPKPTTYHIYNIHVRFNDISRIFISTLVSRQPILTRHGEIAMSLCPSRPSPLAL